MSAARGTSALRFAGYAAIFDRIDQGGDLIRPGAFAGSLKRLAGASSGLGAGIRSVSVSGAGIFTGSTADACPRTNALSA